MDIPETRYAETADGLHIAYQVLGAGPGDLVFAPSFVFNVKTVWEWPQGVADRWRLYRVVT